MRTRFVIAAIVAALNLAACAGPSALRPAREGNIPALRQAIDDDLRAGRLSKSSVADIAEAITSRELRVSQGNAAVQRISQVRACARQFDGVLMDRTKGNDAAAAAAAMALLEVHRGDPDLWMKRAADPDPAWRAVGIRTLVLPAHGKQRRAAILDPDEGVRLAAMRSAEDAHDLLDLNLLLDAARLDPNSLNRVTAVRSIAALSDPSVVLRLKDIWVRADEPVRQAIASAYAWPGLMENGGERELVLVAETEKDTPAIIAAGILARFHGPSRGTGLATLAKAIEHGVIRERELALTLAPLDDPQLRETVKKVAKGSDPEAKVAALTRLAREPNEREAALKELGPMAMTKGPAAQKAKVAMARLGDPRVVSLLVKDGESTSAATRQQAAALLIDMGDYARAVRFLADNDVAVRTAVSCDVMLAAERK